MKVATFYSSIIDLSISYFKIKHIGVNSNLSWKWVLMKNRFEVVKENFQSWNLVWKCWDVAAENYFDFEAELLTLVGEEATEKQKMNFVDLGAYDWQK